MGAKVGVLLRILDEIANEREGLARQLIKAGTCSSKKGLRVPPQDATLAPPPPNYQPSNKFKLNLLAPKLYHY